MAPKRPSPSDDPPSVSSSDDDDDQEPSQHLQSQDQEAESEDPDDELSGDEQPPPNQLDENNKTVSSSSPEGSDAESEPPSSQPVPAPAPEPAPLVDLHVKPISSKPIRSNPEATSLPPPKRAKKEDDDDDDASAVAGGGAASDPAAGKGRQHLFNFKRLWTEEDEIVIMKGIIDYCAAKNKSFDPPNDVDAFHEFIKHNLEIKGSRKQLMNKIRKLKLKYMNNAAKGRVFTVPHEKLTYELSTKIWGSGVGASNSVVRAVDVPKSNGKAKVMLTIKKCENVPPPAPTQNGKEIVTVVPAAQGPSNGSPPPEKENLSESDLFRMSKGSIELDEGFVKRGIDLINDTNKLELEERWRNLQVAEMELFLRRMELVREQTKLMLDACKKH